jgi:hypothetical protein
MDKRTEAMGVRCCKFFGGVWGGGGRHIDNRTETRGGFGTAGGQPEAAHGQQNIAGAAPGSQEAGPAAAAAGPGGAAGAGPAGRPCWRPLAPVPAAQPGGDAAHSPIAGAGVHSPPGSGAPRRPLIPLSHPAHHAVQLHFVPCASSLGTPAELVPHALSSGTPAAFVPCG